MKSGFRLQCLDYDGGRFPSSASREGRRMSKGSILKFAEFWEYGRGPS